MQAFLVSIFGNLFLLAMILILIWVCIKVGIAILGEAQLYRENLKDYYFSRKASQIERRGRIKKIKDRLIKELQTEEKEAKKANKSKS